MPENKDDLFDKNDTLPVITKNEDGSVTIGSSTYKSDEDAFKGKAAADQHVATLEAETKVLREQLEERGKEDRSALNKLMESLNKPKEVSTDALDFGYQHNEPAGERHPSGSEVKAEDIQRIVKAEAQKLMEEAKEKTDTEAALQQLDQNKQVVKEGLMKSLGSEEAVRAAYTKYKESTDFDTYVYGRLLQTNPDKLIRDIVGEKPAPNVSFSPGFKSSSVPQGPGASVGAGRKPWSYYKKMMTGDLRGQNEYYSPEIQQQLKRDTASFRKDGIDFYSK